MPTHESLPPARTRPTVRAVTAATAAALVAGGVVLLAPTGVSAAPAADAHDPIGHIWSTKANTVTSPMTGMPTTTLTMRGWAADPDRRKSTVSVALVLDGSKTLASGTTDRASYATKKYKLGPKPGFAISGVVPTGKHVVCLVVKNQKAGLDALRRCVATPLGRKLTAVQTAKHNPAGKLTRAWANSKSVHYRGYASDRDLANRPLRVVLYVDGRAARTVTTTAYPNRPKGAGPNSRFDILVPVSTVGTHVGCLWAVNVGTGSNQHLGCQAVDNRAPQNRAVPYTAPPAANAKFMKLALKQRGKPYVWGATGPKSFDCSGLTGWVMKKNGYQIPRVSQDQIKAARLIPASHVRPGDLVFLHDTQGDVYHVGFYAKPGKMFAAIQPGDGVNYQNLWDPSAVTYGSFTHT